MDKITGPGNAYVAAAKRRVFGVVGIDMVAGPSEILVICDGQTDPDWIAMDLFSQAEHDEIAQSILLCPDAEFIAARARQHRAPAARDAAPGHHPRLAVRPWRADSGGRPMKPARSPTHRPEHLELSVAEPAAWLPKLKHAGAIFMGRFASESLGDYCAGPEPRCPPAAPPALPVPLGVYDFQKRTSLIEVSAVGAQTLGRIASTLAHGEGLTAHARSAEFRLQD